MSANTTKTTNRRKRPRQEDSPDNEEEKRRGRPRVEKTDDPSEGDPKDRRRLQIRMAQRAYRQRKESTLDELRKRVSDLSNTIELMNKAFVECRDRLYGSSLGADQLRDLHVLSVQFESYLADARNPSEDDTIAPPAKAADPVPKSSSLVEPHLDRVPQASNVNEWLDHAAVATAAKAKPARATDIGMGYEMDYAIQQPEPKSAEYPFLIPKAEEFVSYQINSKSRSLTPFDMNDIDSFDHTILRMSQPTPPTTYSFQERSFARRLFRASLEGAYHLLLDPTRRRVDYERVFKLSLMGRSRAKILRSLRRVMSKTVDDELDHWLAPLIHIGGAGTHYPRRDAHGKPLPKKESKYIGLIGPQALALLDNATRDNISVDMTVEVAGFEGEWFDPFDVQGYLEEKGIFIDPSSSFAEAPLLGSPSHSTDSSSSSASVRLLTPEQQAFGATLPLSSNSSEWHPATSDVDQWNDLTGIGLGNVGFSDAQAGSWMNYLPPDQGMKSFDPNAAPLINWGALMPGTVMTHAQAISPAASKSIIIDVTKFVEVLTVSGVCLGRSPGFRRKDVDRALAIASFDSV